MSIVLVLNGSFFGHNLALLPCLVRSLLAFGLTLALLALPCPKLPLLRTHSRSFGLALSEVAPPSDSISLFWPCLVRSCPSFRLNLALLALPCPRFACLRTHSRSFGLALSEVEPIFKLPLFMVSSP